jgi:hypothetical protein
VLANRDLRSGFCGLRLVAKVLATSYRGPLWDGRLRDCTQIKNTVRARNRTTILHPYCEGTKRGTHDAEAVSSSSLLLRSRRRWRTAPASAAPHPATPAWSARLSQSSGSCSAGAEASSNQSAPRQLQHGGQNGRARQRAARHITQTAAQRPSVAQTIPTSSAHEIGPVLCVNVSDDRSIVSHHAFGRLFLRSCVCMDLEGTFFVAQKRQHGLPGPSTRVGWSHCARLSPHRSK